jgi:hypothetical protein
MKRLLLFIALFEGISIYGQESISKFSFEFGVSANHYEYGEKGFGISNGIAYELNSNFKISPNFEFAYGFYRYFHNQYEPSFVEARYISLRLPVQYKLPKKLNFISLGFGPALTYRSRFENDSFKLNTTVGTTKIYKYDSGNMYNTLYAGLVAQLEAVIYEKNRLSFRLFANCNLYFNPFKLDYFGGGIRTSIKL